ncbi:MAG TPA: hypothetical protein DIT25_01240 [Candidatus Moranbacteria bacterium]|nr:hypothetical protein [Candidatus Moranbacteria bacterium]
MNTRKKYDKKEHKKRYAMARKILGEDFICHKEIQEARKLKYKLDWEDTLRIYRIPPTSVLKWLHKRKYLLIAGPPSKMSLSDIYDLKPKFFGVYKKAFAGMDYDNINPGWLMISKAPQIFGYKKYKIQERCALSGEYVPNIAQIAWAITTYKEVRNKYLLGRDEDFCDVVVRTSTKPYDHTGNHSIIGLFDKYGLHIGSDSDNADDENWQMLFARKPERHYVL